MFEKIKILATKIEQQTIEQLKKNGLGCQCNIDNAKTSIKEGKKYTKINVGASGKYMVDKDGLIFGIKAYGVIHKGHYYGTLDTIGLYFWGGYVARLI